MRSVRGIDMLEEIYYKTKTLVRPVTQNRRLLERAKYLGEEILSPQEGNDLLARSIHRPAAIGKIGSGAMAAVRHYWKLADSQGHCEPWGWEGKNLYRIAGVYPPRSGYLLPILQSIRGGAHPPGCASCVG